MKKEQKNGMDLVGRTQHEKHEVSGADRVQKWDDEKAK